MTLQIAIDGPAASGKSTVAKLLAARLNGLYVNTGEMYRAVAAAAYKLNINPEKNPQELVKHLPEWTLEYKLDPEKDCLELYFNGDPVDHAFLRSKEVSDIVSQAAAIPEGYKVSLPTEAQWEFAARGGKKTKYYPYSGSDIIDDIAWHSENSNASAKPVGMKFPNELNLYDMTGNVWEWCLDACEWENKVKTDTYRDGVVDPVSMQGDLHIIRGGGWLSSPKNCRISNRLCCDTNFKIYNLGLRIVLVPKK